MRGQPLFVVGSGLRACCSAGCVVAAARRPPPAGCGTRPRGSVLVSTALSSRAVPSFCRLGVAVVCARARVCQVCGASFRCTRAHANTHTHLCARVRLARVVGLWDARAHTRSLTRAHLLCHATPPFCRKCKTTRSRAETSPRQISSTPRSGGGNGSAPAARAWPRAAKAPTAARASSCSASSTRTSSQKRAVLVELKSSVGLSCFR